MNTKKSNTSNNKLTTPIDFDFKFEERDKKTNVLIAVYVCIAACRYFDGIRTANFIIWKITQHNMKIGSAHYHHIKDAAMNEYDCDGDFKKSVIYALCNELNKRSGIE